MTDDKELKDQRVVTMMSPSELEAIDDWMFKNRIRSRGEAIRRLCQIGIAFDEHSPSLWAGWEQLDRETLDLDRLLREFFINRNTDIGIAVRIAEARPRVIAGKMAIIKRLVSLLSAGLSSKSESPDKGGERLEQLRSRMKDIIREDARIEQEHNEWREQNASVRRVGSTTSVTDDTPDE